MESDLTFIAGGARPWGWRRTATWVGFRLIDFFVFTPYPVYRWLFWVFLPQRAELERAFDPAFYVAQIPQASIRVKARRWPLLHYWLMGRHLGRWPSPAFDPAAYREAHPHLPPGADLFSHYIRGLGAAHAVKAPEAQPDGDERPVVLVIDHARGGGSTRMLRLYQEKLAGEGWRVLAPRRVVKEAALFVFPGPEGDRVFDLFADEEALATFLVARGARRILVNHLIDLPPDAGAWIAAFAKKVGATYEVLLHDYYLACPRIDLIDSGGRYCGLAEASRCGLCLAESGPALARIDPAAWRSRSQAFLTGAARVTAPSRDLADRLNTVFPAAAIEVWEPDAPAAELGHSRPPPHTGDEALRVVLIGALNWPKGLGVITGLARTLKRLNAPVSITLIGPTEDPGRLRRAGVRVHGWYAARELAGLIERESPHVIFFPAIWPETWSFTLTEALRTPAEIVAFDIGAIAERLKRLGRGRLLPYALHDNPEGLAGAILELRLEMQGRTAA
jgi:glycosyltransferase involved in cell wall biosynthesis